MRLDFQKNIASSQIVLPFVSIVGALIWIFLPISHECRIDADSYGLWSLIPAAVLQGKVSLYASMALAALGVYLLAELNNSNLLLRITSRMLSSMLAVFFGISLCLHTMQPGLVAMPLYLLSYFSLFSTYRLPVPMYTFMSYCCLSIASLVFPMLLFLVPVYWICQAYLRSLSFRCFFASLFGLLVPYWFLFGVLINFEGGAERFVSILSQVIAVVHPDYGMLHLTDYLLFAFSVVFFLFGVINFYMSSYQDKTRVRTLYNVIIIQGLALMIFMVIMPRHYHALSPLLYINSAIVGGHYISLTYSKFSHIYCVVMFVLAVALLAAQIVL